MQTGIKGQGHFRFARAGDCTIRLERASLRQPVGVFGNKRTPLSCEGYERYVYLWEAVILLTGCLTFLRNRGRKPVPGRGESRAHRLHF